MRTQFVTQKPISQPCEFQWSLCKIPTVRGKTKGHLKSLYKDLLSLFSFRTSHSPLRKTLHHLANQFSLQWTSCNQPCEEATYTSHSILTMAHIRGGHTGPSVYREARPRASSPQDSSQVPQAPTVLSSECGVPSSPPQRRYSTRRPPTSPPPEPSVHRIPPKRVRTSGLGETSRHA